MLAIFKREVKSYFYSPIAYVLIGLFILISSIFFLSNLYGGYAEFNSNLSQMNFLLLFILPILTMRTLSEDRKNGTEVLLVTSPVSITGIVVGKYLAALAVFLVMTAITFIYQFILFGFGDPAVAQLVGGYVAFILLGASFISVGVFASSLTESQIIAAVTGIISLLIMWLMGYISNFTTGILAKVLSWFSLLERYNDFNLGILNLGSIVYYLSFIFVFIFLTIRVIEKRRWSRG
ncbi:ABC transporter permease [Clostridium thermosuccinogenes]|jgi:ABC-2 type transport system permease protein|uniref:ABC transporter permease n=1 Tax=Clostridium thermosuccinogenes TaxID=84032 RepID=A0A2K2F5E8_9CLOT|nr:ABC transporter permease [Pseudoclostridium thermosuccinogenes]AUS97758.1 ABC transporter permease [Pseudoclostridium thermosuccinogenes]PNT94000.1 ABC transporter permease [Pseudoclostridium thermosuccinogenes]PNT98122.1 ABC transporter permease [Pseudoclostridium thermosuccinogenes]PNU00093.1 ABC transporter permease [Pseudoclostridium thermosuccinogenes]